MHEKKVVIRKADKDDKIVVVNFKDYNRIMENQPKSFSRISSITSEKNTKTLYTYKDFC